MASDADKRKIVDEALGERPASAIPDAARDRVPEAAQQPPVSVGAEASIAARTAEAVGERGSTGAYADPAADRASSRSRTLARRSSIGMTSRFGGRSYLGAAAIFALGYAAALLIHRRRFPGGDWGFGWVTPDTAAGFLLPACAEGRVGPAAPLPITFASRSSRKVA